MDQPVLRDVSLQASTMLNVYTSMLERLRYDATVYLDNLLQRAKRLNNQAVVKHCHRDKQTLEVAGATVAGRMVDALALTGLHTLSQHDCEGLDNELIEFHLSDLYHRSARSLHGLTVRHRSLQKAFHVLMMCGRNKLNDRLNGQSISKLSGMNG